MIVMEEKKFFSKSMNILSVAILLAGLTTFGAGAIISETNARDMQKERVDLNMQIDSLEDRLFQAKVDLQKKDLEKQKHLQEAQRMNSKIANLTKENANLKKKIETYKDGSESPSVRQKNNIRKTKVVKSQQQAKRVLYMEATAYTAFCSEGCTGMTSTGYNVANTTKVDGMRVVAVDPNVIPMYSIIKIEARGETFYAQALDKGGAIRGHKLDVLVRNESIAKQFGRQKHVKVSIMRIGKG
jgi:3D (Asp-Asp-Asp) domain-containing protein